MAHKVSFPQQNIPNGGFIALTVNLMTGFDVVLESGSQGGRATGDSRSGLVRARENSRLQLLPGSRRTENSLDR